MTVGQLAALIAALAFLALVIGLLIFLLHLSKTIMTTSQSIQRLSRDMSDVANQSERVLAASNGLLNELERKLKTMTPAFRAAADLGRSLSRLNRSTNRMFDKVHHHRIKKSLLARLGAAVLHLFSFKRQS